MTAENYHLKWDSHLSYLNSSVATLYKNEKYADVVLYSSNVSGSIANSMPAVGISAHKFILSSCSQFFSTIFETSPITNNGIFYIVLPPDLSHRAIQILVQYMYVGEATVSNDILSEVLRGGEILKIRGLCRTSTNTSSQQQQQSRNAENQNSASSSSYNLTRMPINSGPTSVRYLMEQQQQQHSRGLGASVMPKDSPVIIKSPKPLSTLASSTAAITKPPSSGITVNKQVAIDPGDKCCYTQDSLSSNCSIGEAPSSICNEIGCNSCPRIAENLQPMILRRERSQSDDPTVLCRKSCLESCDEQNYLRHASNDFRDDEEGNDSSRIYDNEIRRSSLPAERTDTVHDYLSEHYSNHLSHIAHSKHGIIRENVGGTLNGARGNSGSELTQLPSPTNHNQEPSPFVTIKEEPTDWLPSSSTSLTQQNNNIEPSNKIINKVENFQTTTHIKTETSASASSSINNIESDCHQILAAPSSILQPPIANDFDRYFSCDVCNKTCEDNASLIRHLETHTGTPCSSGFSSSTGSETSVLSKSYVPKKRRRISQQENSMDHVCLQCDLCSTPFETPAEWVRHMNSQHTEVELAMFNNKKDKEKTNSSSSNSHKKINCNRQPHQLQSQQSQHVRTQVLNGSTNSNSTSLLTTSPNQSRHDASSDYLRSTLSPA